MPVTGPAPVPVRLEFRNDGEINLWTPDWRRYTFPAGPQSQTECITECIYLHWKPPSCFGSLLRGMAEAYKPDVLRAIQIQPAMHRCPSRRPMNPPSPPMLR
jgi:hypothetical protein